MKKVTINFAEVICESIDGKKEPVDMSDKIGKELYYTTRSLPMVELARRIYKDKTVELTIDEAKELKSWLQQALPVFSRRWIIEQLNSFVINDV